jgi:hypothetical protein
MRAACGAERSFTPAHICVRVCGAVCGAYGMRPTGKPHSCTGAGVGWACVAAAFSCLGNA